MTKTYLDKAYALETPEDTQKLYDDWAASYDAEVGQNGYATPGRVAKALFGILPDASAPILDFGCGTGLSGLALKLEGYNVIDGMDPNAQMLEGARAKGLYRNLTTIDVTDAKPIPAGHYKAIAAIGVVGTGAAPPETLDILMHALISGDLLAFSLNDHALADTRFEGTLNGWLDCGAARLLVKEYGPHLPGQNINSNVYIVQKA